MTTADGTADADDVAESLRRLELLIAALDALPDARAKEPARALLELVLDLHGLALARVAAIATRHGGPELLGKLAEDETIRAMLLLHGLHPEEAPVRIVKALATLPVPVELVHADASRARLRVCLSRHADPAGLRATIEAVVVEAAPELDEIIIDGLDAADADGFAALTGMPPPIGEPAEPTWLS